MPYDATLDAYVAVQREELRPALTEEDYPEARSDSLALTQIVRWFVPDQR
ncbi:hypothetical protein [Enhygromyxa salina]|nr:hypothetical protein [Enhygromyxa salina]